MLEKEIWMMGISISRKGFARRLMSCSSRRRCSGSSGHWSTGYKVVIETQVSSTVRHLQRRKKNPVCGLEDGNGDWKESFEKMEDIAISYF
ncbi:hypothetical protein PTKIN_Ptkin16aG0081600 [Pterospermum kingtungense]